MPKIFLLIFPDDNSCDPTTPTTYLFAYSNDFTAAVVGGVWEYISGIAFGNSHYSQVGTVRFDVMNEENIAFNTDKDTASASIQAHLPNPSLSFPSTSTGSDILKTLTKFLDNTQAPICGSRLFLLVKRYPNETDISELVGRLRQHYVVFTAMVSMTPSGGVQASTVYQLATRTNGFCAYNYDEDFEEEAGHVPGFYNPYLVYASNPQVPGQSGSTILPPFPAPTAGSYWLSMTIQDHIPIDSVNTISLSWQNGASQDGFGIDQRLYNTNHISNYESLDQVTYNMTLQYSFSDNNPETIQIRIYGASPINYWAPYDN